jgi:hypothetical protein
MNYLVVSIAALVPLLVGFVWYNNAFGFGKSWMKETGLTLEKLRSDFSPIRLFGTVYLLGVFIALALAPMVIHQYGFRSMMMGVDGINDSATEVGKAYAFLMENHSENFRGPGHGALHGAISGLMLVFPVLAINALFERKSWKYIFIHLGFWVVTLALMGAIVCTYFQLLGA